MTNTPPAPHSSLPSQPPKELAIALVAEPLRRDPCTLLDVRQLAARLGVSQKWIREEANAKRIPSVKAGPSSYLFDPELVDRVIAERAFNLDAAIYDRKSLINTPPAEQSDDLVRVVNLTVELGAHAWRCGWDPSPYIDALAEVGVKVEFSIPIRDSIRKFRALRQLDAQWPQYRPRDFKLRPHTQESRP